MRRKFTRESIYFLFFIFLLLVIIADRYTTVYPSLVFPSFSRAPVIKNEAYFPVTELWGVTPNGKQIRLNEDSLFYEVDFRYATYVLKTIAKKLTNKKDIKGYLFIKKYLQNHLDSIYHTNFEGIFIVRGERTFYSNTRKLGNEISKQRTLYIPLK